MLKLEGFKIIEEIAHPGSSLLYRAQRIADGQPCILKTYDVHSQGLRSRARINHEHEIARYLDGEGTTRYENAVKSGHRLVLVMQDFGAITLRELMEQDLGLLEKLHMARIIAQQLARIHAKGIVHKDIKPDNILVNPQNQDVRIIDFGLAARTNSKGQVVISAHEAEGSPQYIAPEQTGRVNLAVDCRSDLYALGITYFEFFTGRLPFPEATLNALIYAQIAKQAPRLGSVLPGVPGCVDAVVHRLLQKSPANRYQSAAGLVDDLERCLAVLEGKATDTAFVPGQNDYSTQFVLSQRLVGRDTEVAQLNEAFQRAVGGGKELVFVAGESGTGKSVLVRELLPALARENGLFLSGKFDAQRGGTPFGGIVAALGDFADFLMRQGEQSLAVWRQDIHGALGGLTRVLIDLAPELERVLGSHQSLPEVLPEDAQARFALAMRGLFHAIATEQHPVILFLDDLQWADANSVQFIEALVLDTEVRNLLLIGAYRDEGLDVHHPIHGTMDKLQKAFPFRHIHLGALDEGAVLQLLTESFPRHVGDLGGLAGLVAGKTAGNPYFVGEFLGSLHDQGLIVWDGVRLGWAWDVGAIQRVQFTGNVIGYLCDRVRRLEPDALELLKLAACIGTRFELETLAFNTGLSVRVVREKLDAAVGASFVVGLEARGEGLEASGEESGEGVSLVGDVLRELVCDYRLLRDFHLRFQFSAPALPSVDMTGGTMDFVHDRVREAVYSLIGDEEKARYHLRLGETALKVLEGEALERNIFEIVTHLDIGAALVADRGRRHEMAVLNLRAARKASKAAAFSVALKFVQAGTSLLATDCWESQYDTAYALHAEHAALLFLLEDPHAADKAFTELVGRARTRLEKLQLYTTHVLLLVHTGGFKRCEELGAAALALFGIQVPRAGRLKGPILKELIKAKFKMMGKTEAKLVAQPQVKDPEMKALLEFLAYLGLAFGASNAELFTFVVMRGFNLSLKHGIADPNTSYYHYYGLISLMAFGDYKGAYTYSSLSLKIFDLYPSVAYKERTELGFYGWIALWQDDVRPFVKRYAAIHAKALEYGDMIIAALSGDMRLWLMSLMGYPLAQVEEECNHHLAFLGNRSEEQSIVLVKALLRSRASLVGESDAPWSLDGEGFVFEEIRKRLLERGAENVLGGMYTKRMQLLFLFDRGEELPGIMAEGHVCIEKMANTFVETEYYLFETLLIFRVMWPDATRSHDMTKALKKQLALNLKRIALWNKRCPLNFAIFHVLVTAEQARVEGRFGEAEALYEKAVAIAEEKNWTHLTGVANELAGRHYVQRGKLQVARVFLEEARMAYLEWGATAKVKLLEATYKEVLPRLSTESRFASGSLTSSSGRISIDVDLTTILAASQAISGQIKLEGLLTELLTILVQNAGAEKGCFLMNRDNRLWVEAQVDPTSRQSGRGTGQHGVELMDQVPAFGKGILPESVLHYVDHKREAVILENAVQDPQFGEDAYFKVHACRSVMTVPVVKEGRLLGIIYLENNQSPGVFTPDRVQLVQMLSGQIAVSIDNALVYENLEGLVVERTQEIRRQKDHIAQQNEELEKEKRKSDDLLLNILPREIAEELKATGKAKAQKYALATVMFTDIVGFTKIAEAMSPEELVAELDICFSAFDKIQRKYGLEKVKTIGDAYMCMAGVPVPKANSPVMAVLAGLEMQAFMQEMAANRKELGAQFFEMRLGMHSGEIVAGVVGTEKFAYDIWGDTVNLAARLESAGVTGKVNISEATYALVKDYFECVHRGKVSVKNKADVEMYFVVGLTEKGRAVLAEVDGVVVEARG